MNVIVDTSVWSLALRRSTDTDSPLVDELRTLIADRRVVVLGPIRQELLSGVRDVAQFERLRECLAAFPDHPLTEADYVLAARFFNVCRAEGVEGSNTDFLICAVAVNHRLSILTTDQDFGRYAERLPIELYRLP